MDIMSFYSRFNTSESDALEHKADEYEQEVSYKQEIEAQENLPTVFASDFVVTMDYLKAKESCIHCGKSHPISIEVTNKEGKSFYFLASRILNKPNEFFISVRVPIRQSFKDYYMAVLNASNKLVFTRNSMLSENSIEAKVFNWTLKVISGNTGLPEGYSIKPVRNCPE